MPDVSVIIPTWNRADLLCAAVASAAHQSFPSIEILVCDDGSTDVSEERIAAIDDSRVRWLRGERGGRPAIPRNRGIRESRGEWIAFLDNDDEWHPAKLARQIELATRLGCKAACSNAVRFVPGKGSQGNYLTWRRERVTFDDLLLVNQVICSSAVVHRSLLDAVVAFPEAPELRALEDYALWLRVATMTDFAFVAEPLVVYRDEAANSVRQHDVDVWRQRQTVFQDFLAWGRQQGIEDGFLRKVSARLKKDRTEKVVNSLLAPAKKLKKALLS